MMSTDGSFIPNAGGRAAKVTESVTFSHGYGSTTGISTYEMEATGLFVAFVNYWQNHYNQDPSNL
ncbi:hypothetical protein CROQUDRAFT_651442 [Cronartium quercuum f. sp. fusiforme G11]|uniref:Uncharacterized protein n=1 Tax=Cronartium quercuum f. sp. fusiforme G11 TaxID=708437 RepID=A0A9P6NS50_9BASI|nr:hypothetical protein CROQUDRAFT_651442 [Cronartium quercuum f. sp. fusiforme G11]